MKWLLIRKYIIIYIPVICGIVLFSFGVINLVSSILLFLGGYIAIKNTLDYRKVRKHINNSMIKMDMRREDTQCIDKEKNIPYNYKRVKRNIRVRKREKK